MSAAPRFKWYWITRAAAALLVLAIGVSIAGVLLMTAPKPPEVMGGAKPPQINVFEAKAIPIRRQWTGYGVSGAIDRGDVPARVTATVTSIPKSVQAGRPINAGDTIAELDSSDFNEQLTLAQKRIAELDALLLQINVEAKRYAERLKIETEDVRLADTEVTRLERLIKEDAAKQRELDAAKRASISAQRAELATRELIDKIEPRKTAWQALRDGQESQKRTAQQNIDRCKITSPIDGVLQAVDVKLGESLTAGQRVARVVSLSRVEVPVQLPVAARADIVIGGAVRLTATNDTEICWDAKVTRLSPEDDATTRTMSVYVEVDQAAAAKQFGSAAAGHLLTPGMFVAANVESDVVEPRWIVPRRSIRAGRVLVVKDGILISRPVKIDFLYEGTLPQFGVPDDQWAVLVNNSQPLQAGEQVVLNASVAVRDGDKVDPIVGKAEHKVDQKDPPTGVGGL